MRLLLLAGTAEAHHIARALLREAGLSLTVSLAKPEWRPKRFGWPVRIGGFGDEGAYADWLETGGFNAVLDATHPFATVMGHRTLALSDRLGIEYIRFLRPSWLPSDRDNWVFLNHGSEAADHIPRGSNVLLVTGQRSLDDFKNLTERRILCRVRDAGARLFPFESGRYVPSHGPFTVHRECDFLLDEKIDWIISQNAGGQGSWPKIEAARELGLPVAMVRRPPQPQGMRINSVAEAISWVRRRLLALGG
ncbi:MAG: precorrin-6A/cobalt-precorrin-6A reductase [Pseudomonadota bacterium]